MKLLFVLDGILYRVLAATQEDPSYYHHLRSCNMVMERILDEFDNCEYVAALSGRGNFRKKLYPQYKANRDYSLTPRYLPDVRNFFVKYWDAVVVDGMEADDYLASLWGPDTVGVVNDKDYNQLGGLQYNPWKSELKRIDNPWFHFWVQVLCGDKIDNIPGLLNPKKLHHKTPPCFTENSAGELLEGKTPNEQRQIVEQQYQLIYGDNWYERFDLIANLLWLRRDINKTYRDYLPD